MKRILRAAIPAILLLPAFVLADRITLSTGRVVPGEIELQTAERVSIRTSQGLLFFPTSTIAKIELGDVRQDYPKQISDSIEARNLVNSLKYAAAGAMNLEVLHKCDAVFLAKADAVVSLAGEASDSDSRAFKKYVVNRETSPPVELTILLCKFMDARGDSAGAILQLSGIASELLHSNARQKAVANSLLRLWVAKSVESSDPDASLIGLQLLSRISAGTGESGMQAMLYLQQSEKLGTSGRFLEALELIRVHAAPIIPVLAWDETEKILKSAEPRTTEPAFIKLAEIAEDAFSTAAVAGELIPIMTKHINLLTASQQFADAFRVSDRLSLIDADEGARLSHLIEFEKRRHELAVDDYVGRYKLGIWARDMGLTSQALQCFKIAQTSPDLRENASLQIQLMDVEKEKEEFQKCVSLFDARKYQEALASAEAFRKTHPSSEFSKRAGELIELAKYRLWRISKAKPAEAEALYQNAERFFMQDRYTEALTFLDRIETDFPGTQAASQASSLRARVHKAMKRSSTQDVMGSGKAESLQQVKLKAERMKEIRALTEGITGQIAPNP